MIGHSDLLVDYHCFLQRRPSSPPDISFDTTRPMTERSESWRHCLTGQAAGSCRRHEMSHPEGSSGYDQRQSGMVVESFAAPSGRHGQSTMLISCTKRQLQLQQPPPATRMPSTGCPAKSDSGDMGIRKLDRYKQNPDTPDGHQDCAAKRTETVSVPPIKSSTYDESLFPPSTIEFKNNTIPPPEQTDSKVKQQQQQQQEFDSRCYPRSSKMISKIAKSYSTQANFPSSKTLMAHLFQVTCCILLLVSLSIHPIGCLKQNEDNPKAHLIGQEDGSQQQQPLPLPLDHHRFKYHLNHLRPPSLVPITIQQATTIPTSAPNSANNHHQEPTLASIEPNNNNGQQLRAWPSQHQATSTKTTTTMTTTLGGSTNLRPPLMATSANYDMTSGATKLGRGRHQRASGQGVEGDMAAGPVAAAEGQLVQLQLPLQLHLKLRPLPLPMPPPSDRRSSQPSSSSSSSEEMANSPKVTSGDSLSSAEKRKRSLEPAVEPQAKQQLVRARENELERNDLLMFAWREAKRVLLLNSMSPALKQAGKLERRTADLKGAESGSVVSGSGSSSRILEPRQGLTGGPEVPANPPATNARQTTLNYPFRGTESEEGKGGDRIPRERYNLKATSGEPKWQSVLPDDNKRRPQQVADKSTQRRPIEATRPPGEPATLGASTLKPPIQVMLMAEAKAENLPTRDKEVRRQRHSSQQQLQGGFNELTTILPQPADLDDARIQAMAAAMLPLVWPSFHLAGASSSQQLIREPWQAGQAAAAARQDGSQQLATSAWPMKYMQLSRPHRQQQQHMNETIGLANVQPAPTTTTHSPPETVRTTANPSVDSPTTPTTTTSTTIRPPVMRQTHPAITMQAMSAETLDSLEPSAKVRAKRRKPSYLAQATASSTPYPDSVRMASKYPMPRIKFRVPEQQQQQQKEQQSKQQLVPENPTIIVDGANKRLISSEQTKIQRLQAETASSKQIANLPKSLSKLIEQQLLANATSLLQHHKSQMGGPPPTTSTSRVVRLIKSNTTTTMEQVDRKKFESSEEGAAKRQLAKKFSQLMDDPSTSSMRRHSSARVQVHTLAPPELKSSPIITTTTTVAPTIASQQQQVATTSVSVIATTRVPATTNKPPPTISLTTTTTSRRPRGQIPTSTPATTTTLNPTTTTTTTSTTTSASTTPAAASTTSTSVRVDEPKSHLPKRRPSPSPVGRKRDSGQQRDQPRVDHQALEDQMTGSNKILPDEEEQQQLISPRNNWTRSGAARKMASGPEKSDGPTGPGIKLFHFKRKPDMNKLPFYKRPLNYTELGWTPEQIQEHQEAWKRAAEVAGGDSAAAGGSGDDDTSGSIAAVILNEGADGRQRRKRRGKNHFERLMGELHATGNTLIPAEQGGSYGAEESGSTTKESAEAEEDAASSSELNQEAADDALASNKQKSNEATSGGEERVPVIRKKTEPLVLRPMFSIMNHKRRFSNLGTATAIESSTVLEPSQTAQSPNQMDEAPPMAKQGDAASAPQHNFSRPVVRMRRKHHGEQPLILSTGGFGAHLNDEPWRPSKPLLWTAQGGGNERLLLVPTGLLTPSGNQLVPMLNSGQNSRQVESAEDRNRLAVDLLAWRPARHQAQESEAAAAPQWRPTTTIDSVKPSDGLAPSGEESFLRAPGEFLADSVGANQMVATDANLQHQEAENHHSSDKAKILLTQQTNMSLIVKHQQQQSVNGSELKVPRLLSKPMRPAKYSLNGYIPKPTLGQQQQQLSPQQVRAPPGSKPRWPPGANKNVASSTSSNGRDLDSSTSNEVFSRRRGLQQHQRSAQPKSSQLSFNSLLVGNSAATLADTQTAPGKQRGHPASAATGETASTSTAAAALELSAHLRQLEENKRKYLVHQPAKSPTLSAQKANLIKAKLGLIVTQMGGSGSSSSKSAAASANRVGELADADDGQRSSAAYLQQQAASNPNAIVTFKAKAHQQQLQPVAATAAAASTDQIPMAGAAQTSAIPKTDFECTDSKGRFVAGLFADHKTGCQVWHLCSNNRKYSFLCPSGTIFSAQSLICDWKYNVKCENPLAH